MTSPFQPDTPRRERVSGQRPRSHAPVPPAPRVSRRRRRPTASARPGAGLPPNRPAVPPAPIATPSFAPAVLLPPVGHAADAIPPSAGGQRRARSRHGARSRRGRPERGPGVGRDRGHRPAGRADQRLVEAPTASATSTSTGITTVQTADLTSIVSDARQSVVTITADGMATSRFSPFGVPTSGVGSGIIISSDGYILTNRHVSRTANSLSVELYDGQHLSGHACQAVVPPTTSP